MAKYENSGLPSQKEEVLERVLKVGWQFPNKLFNLTDFKKLVFKGHTIE